MDDVVESLDTALRDMANEMSASFSDASFGLGLSGGLDSRIALHYFQEQGIEPYCFNISVSKPHHVLLANNVKRSRDLARIASCNYRDIEWKPGCISEKMDMLLRMQPLGTAGHYTNAFKYEESNFPHIDVLLTAGQVLGSHLVGASAPLNSAEMSVSEIVDYLFLKRNCDSVRAFRYDVQMVRRHLGKGLLNEDKGPGAEVWNALATDEAREELRAMIRSDVENKLNEDWCPADIFLEFITNTQSSIARYGAYESRFGTMRSFTLYSPHMFKAGLEWDVSLIEDRKILKELIRKKIPRFASIGEERIGSVKQRNSKAAILLNKLEFFLRGDGIMADEWRSGNGKILAQFEQDMTNDCVWFKSLFPKTEDWKKMKVFSPSRKGVVWDIKRFIDCLETKEYLRF